ncbi:MAG: L-seryl-tRNA(Sec) selenium transferase [Thermoanaerobaculaceae bacterium]
MERRLPAVHKLLDHPRLVEARQRLGHETVRQAVREFLAACRAQNNWNVSLEEALEQVSSRLASLPFASYPSVINATGVLIHTNLGRAPRLEPPAGGYLALELERETGRRGERLGPVRERLTRYFASEDALVVTNNAAALFLLLTTHARGREVIVSRGELIEIGGSFRLPEIMEAAGARLVEVGCTNRTHLSDYQKALSPNTAAILQVHRSNFALTGFVASPDSRSLARLAQEAGVRFWVDQGSGCHLDLSPFGLKGEATVQALLADGAEVVLFSGDKLFGGPQAGILVGQRSILEPLRHHPLRRALRPDKGVLVALAATLDAYLAGDLRRVPLYKLLLEPPSSLRRRARRLAKRLTTAGVPAKVVSSWAVLGGGTTPGQTLPSLAVALEDNPSLAQALRLGNPPVIPRHEEGRLLLDLKAVFPEQDGELAQAVLAAWTQLAR